MKLKDIVHLLNGNEVSVFDKPANKVHNLKCDYAPKVACEVFGDREVGVIVPLGFYHLQITVL